MTPAELLLSKLPDAKRNGKEWQARCPAHDDRQPSLSIAEGDNGGAVVNCHAGCTTEAVISAVGLTMADLMPRTNTHTAEPVRNAKSSNPAEVFASAREAVAALERRHGRRSADWTYHDAEGKPLGLVVRWDGPKGKDVRPVSRNGQGWIIGGMPEPRPLYDVPELLNAPAGSRVYVCEGEKAADAAGAVGLIATTSPHGSKSAAKADWSPLAGHEVVIVPDADDAGERYAEDVAGMLVKLTPAPVVKIVRPPDLPFGEGGDLADFVALRGGDAEAIKAEVETLADRAEPVEWKSKAPGPVMVNLADVQPQPIRWLWRGRIATGKLTVLASDPGLGKSTLTVDMAARVSKGTTWPDSPGQPIEPGGVVLLTAEDDLADTVRPRLDAAGADVLRVKAMQAVRTLDDDGQPGERMIDLSRDIRHIEQAITQTDNCRLVVIDPISAYLGDTDSHKNAEVRGLLAPLAALAEKHEVAVLAVSHLRKGGGEAIYRTMGSLAFVAAARAAWCVCKDKDDPARRLFLPVKNNIASDHGGLAYRLEPADNGMATIAWEPEPVGVSADDALNREAGDSQRGSAVDEAVNWLTDLLSDGPLPAKDVKAKAEHDGIKERTLDRAKSQAGVLACREGFDKGSRWVWKLPAAPKNANGWATPTLAQNGQLAHYGDSEASARTETGGSPSDFRSAPIDEGRRTTERASADRDEEWGEL